MMTVRITKTKLEASGCCHLQRLVHVKVNTLMNKISLFFSYWVFCELFLIMERKESNDENLFLITVNLAKMIKKEEKSNFIMLIDLKEITVVYEFMAWIKCVFSFKECFHIVHSNSLIHELEDIRILKILKTIE